MKLKLIHYLYYISSALSGINVARWLETSEWQYGILSFLTILCIFLTHRLFREEALSYDH